MRPRGAPERPGSSQGVREAPQGGKTRFVAHPRGPKMIPFWIFFDPEIDEILVRKPVAKKSVSGSSFCDFWVPKGGPTPPKCCVYQLKSTFCVFHLFRFGSDFWAKKGAKRRQKGPLGRPKSAPKPGPISRWKFIAKKSRDCLRLGAETGWKWMRAGGGAPYNDYNTSRGAGA